MRNIEVLLHALLCFNLSISFRYTEWVKHSGVPNYQPMWNKIFKGPSIELYDHKLDPDENINVAFNPEHKEMIKKLSEQLHEGWRDALPPKYKSN